MMVFSKFSDILSFDQIQMNSYCFHCIKIEGNMLLQMIMPFHQYCATFNSFAGHDTVQHHEVTHV